MERRYKVLVCDSQREADEAIAATKVSVVGDPIAVGEKIVVRFVGRHSPTWKYTVAVLDTDERTIIYG